MPAATKMKMRGIKKKKRANRNTYDISSTKRVTRKFHVVVVSPINVIINHINGILTINVIKVNHKCNTHTINVIKINHKCSKLLTINIIKF